MQVGSFGELNNSVLIGVAASAETPKVVYANLVLADGVRARSRNMINQPEWLRKWHVEDSLRCRRSPIH